VYQFLLILKQFSQFYNKKLQGCSFFPETHRSHDSLQHTENSNLCKGQKSSFWTPPQIYTETATVFSQSVESMSYYFCWPNHINMDHSQNQPFSVTRLTASQNFVKIHLYLFHFPADRKKGRRTIVLWGRKMFSVPTRQHCSQWINKMSVRIKYLPINHATFYLPFAKHSMKQFACTFHSLQTQMASVSQLLLLLLLSYTLVNAHHCGTQGSNTYGT